MVAALLALALLGPPSEKEALLALDVKDAPVAGIVAALAEAGGLQAVLDPGVSCRLTVKFAGVTYAEALDNVLRACGLGYEAEGTVVRVATRARLAQEGAERRRLSEAQRQAAPRGERRVRLSYARAAQVAPLVKRFLSPRGEVAFDERTNTLIILD